MVLAPEGRDGEAALLGGAIRWGIALFEYFLAVPANRIGYASGWSAGQLKMAQEVIVLALFMVVVLKEPLGWRHAGAFAGLVGAAGCLFAGR